MKRIISMLLIFGTLAGVLPVSAQSASRYRLNMPDTQECAVGNVVAISIALEQSGAGSYNAYDLTVKFDEDRLELVSCDAAEGENGSVQKADGAVRLLGYGSDKDASKPVATLSFRVKKAGWAEVTVKEAYIDSSNHAVNRNTPAVLFGENGNKTRIHCGYTVVAGSGLESETGGALKEIAFPDEEYRFVLENNKYFTDDLTVIVGKEKIAVSYDEDMDVYFIAADDIKGDVKISRTGKKYKVTVSGNDFIGKKQAYYAEDYTFRLDRKKGCLYQLTVTINGKKYTKYTVDQDIYTIPGRDITGDIKIKIKRTGGAADKVEVDFAGSGDKDGKGDKKTLLGIEYPFTIKKKKGYTYTISVFVNGQQVGYDYDEDLDKYYIPAEKVAGDITIVVNKVQTVMVNDYITLDGQSIYLILYNGIVPEGQIPRYEGRSLYWSDSYRAYAYLVMSKETEKKVKKAAEEAIQVSEGALPHRIHYSGDVDQNNRLETNDVQMIDGLYNGRYLLSDMEQVRFLYADVNGDRRVNVRDVAAVINRLYGN